MALEEVTSFSATGYTHFHNHESTTTYNVNPGSNLRIRNGPGGDYEIVGQHDYGDWWTVAESYNGWSREPGWDGWSSNSFMTNPNPSAPSPGEFRVNSFKVTATRETASTKQISVKYEWWWNNARGTTETYYHWRVYCFAAKNGGEAQYNIHGDTQSIGSNGSGYFTETWTMNETSGNTTLHFGNYGVRYTSWGGYRNPDGGVSNSFTFNIPKYQPSPVRQLVNGTWETIPIKHTSDGSNVTVKQFNGSSWIDL